MNIISLTNRWSCIESIHSTCMGFAGQSKNIAIRLSRNKSSLDFSEMSISKFKFIKFEFLDYWSNSSGRSLFVIDGMNLLTNIQRELFLNGYLKK